MEHTLFSKYAGLIVCVTSSLFVGGVLIILFLQIGMIEQDLPDFAVHHQKIDCETETCQLAHAAMLVENDVLRTRYTAVQSSMSSRLMIFVTAEIVALTMAVLGSVLIFDRIRANGEAFSIGETALPAVMGNDGDGNAAMLGQSSMGWKAVLNTSFPGLILCAFATLVLVASLVLVTSQRNKIIVNDIPFFNAKSGVIDQTSGVGAALQSLGIEEIE